MILCDIIITLQKPLFTLFLLDFVLTMLFYNKISQKMRILTKIIAFFFLFSLMVSCGGFQKVDTRKVPIKGSERAKTKHKRGKRDVNWQSIK